MHSLPELFNPENYFFNPYSIPDFLLGISALIFGTFILLKNRRLEGFGLFLTAICIFGWLVGYSVMFSCKNMSIAFFWDKISYFFVCFISLGSYILALGVTKNENRKDKILALFYFLLMGLFGLLIFFTELIIKYPLRKYFWGYHSRVGPLHPVFLLLWGGIAIKSFYCLVSRFKDERILLERTRLRIFTITYSLAYVGVYDFLADYGIGLYPFGYLFVFTYLVLIGYNLIKYKAFGFETVFHKTILWIAAIFLIVFPVGFLEFILLYFLMPSLHPFVNILVLNLVLISFSYYYFHLRPQIDRFFGKKEYAYYELLGRISEKITSSLDVEEISFRLLSELDSCILPQKIYLWIFIEKKQKFSLIAQKIETQPLEFYQGEERISIHEEDLIIQYLNKTKKVLEPSLAALDPKFQYLRGSSCFSFLQQELIEVLVPLVMQDSVIGILALGRKRSLRAYTQKDIVILTTLGKELGTSIYNALHHEDIVEKERLEEELRLGRDIQTALLPKELPQLPGFSFSGLMLPAKEIGGDYYDFIVVNREQGAENRERITQNREAVSPQPLAIGREEALSVGKKENPQTLAIVIGDVSGKGVAAGLIMATAKATLKGLSQQNLSPRQILAQTNNLLYEYTNGQKFMTLLYFRYNPEDKTLTYSSAGHEHILVYRSDTATLECIASGGFMLGMLEDIEPYLEERTLALNPKDKLLLYTDGVTDAESPTGERFGLERLKESFKNNSPKPCQELILSIKDEVYSFMALKPQYDDITLVGMEAVVQGKEGAHV